MNTLNIDAPGIGNDVLLKTAVDKDPGRLMNTPMLIAAADILREIVPVLSHVASEASLSDVQRKIGDPLSPRLTRPKQISFYGKETRAEPGSSTNSTHNALLLASMEEVLEQGNWGRMASNADAAIQRDATRVAENTRLVADYDIAQNAVTNALATLSEATDVLSSLAGKNAELKQQLQEVQDILATLVSEDPEYDAVIEIRDNLLEEIHQGESDLMQEKKNVNTLQVNAIGLQKEVDELMSLFEQLGLSVPREIVEKDINNMERMLTLMTQLGDMMLKIAEVRVETQRSIVKQQEDIRFNKLIEDAEKADRDIAKAEALNKAMGYVGKILGGVVMAAAFVGAVFTGGASLVLAGVGLGLMLTDYIYQEATGNSFMADAMKPVIKLIQPVLELLMNITSSLLEKFGMDAAAARTVGLMIVIAVLAAGTVALTLAGLGSAMARLTSNIISKLGSVFSKIYERAIARITSEAFKQGMANMSKNMSGVLHRGFQSVLRLFGINVENMYRTQIIGQHISHFSVIGGGVHIVAAGGFTVAEKSAELDAAEAVASMRFTSAELGLLQEMSSSLIEQCRNSVSAAMTLFDSNSKAIAEFADAGKSVAIAIGTARAL